MLPILKMKSVSRSKHFLSKLYAFYYYSHHHHVVSMTDWMLGWVTDFVTTMTQNCMHKHSGSNNHLQAAILWSADVLVMLFIYNQAWCWISLIFTSVCVGKIGKIGLSCFDVEKFESSGIWVLAMCWLASERFNGSENGLSTINYSNRKENNLNFNNVIE